MIIALSDENIERLEELTGISIECEEVQSRRYKLY